MPVAAAVGSPGGCCPGARRYGTGGPYQSAPLRLLISALVSCSLLVLYRAAARRGYLVAAAAGCLLVLPWLCTSLLLAWRIGGVRVVGAIMAIGGGLKVQTGRLEMVQKNGSTPL